MAFSPNSSLLSKFNPQNIAYMHPKGTSYRAPMVKFIERLDLEQKISSMVRHCLMIQTGMYKDLANHLQVSYETDNTH